MSDIKRMVFNQEDIDLLQKILDATSTSDTSMAFVAVECVGISVKIRNKELRYNKEKKELN